MIDHCVAFFRSKQKEEAYRIYVTDTMKAMSEIIAKTYGGNSPKYRYAEIIGDNKTEQEERRTPQEIISNMKDKLSKMAGD